MDRTKPDSPGAYSPASLSESKRSPVSPSKQGSGMRIGGHEVRRFDDLDSDFPSPTAKPLPERDGKQGPSLHGRGRKTALPDASAPWVLSSPSSASRTLDPAPSSRIAGKPVAESGGRVDAPASPVGQVEGLPVDQVMRRYLRRAVPASAMPQWAALAAEARELRTAWTRLAVGLPVREAPAAEGLRLDLRDEDLPPLSAHRKHLAAVTDRIAKACARLQERLSTAQAAMQVHDWRTNAPEPHHAHWRQLDAQTGASTQLAQSLMADAVAVHMVAWQGEGSDAEFARGELVMEGLQGIADRMQALAHATTTLRWHLEHLREIDPDAVTS